MGTLKTYFQLTKPGIVMGNAITCFGGFALGSGGHINLMLLFFTLFGLNFVVAAGCVVNNFIDRHHDKKMERTKNRALVKGVIGPNQALIFGAILLLIGALTLAFVAMLPLLLALAGFVVYLIFYSYSKYKTVHATLIGSIAGAVPPVVGYTAVTHQLDFAALILFLMIALWQMPHFYAIALYRLKEYAAASIPVLPVVRGFKSTHMQMTLYILGFISICSLLPIMGYTSYTFFYLVLLVSALWLGLCLAGFKKVNERVWARKMFLYSLVVVMGVCFLIPFTV